jgi:hypothetical protein
MSQKLPSDGCVILKKLGALKIHLPYFLIFSGLRSIARNP